jgi:hypothetical protein
MGWPSVKDLKEFFEVEGVALEEVRIIGAE